MDIENWQFNRAEAAAIVGITDAQLKNYQTRYGLFPSKKQGTGRATSYDIRDLIKLAAMDQMVRDGFHPEKAAYALASYSLWGTLLNEGANQFSTYPGTFFLVGDGNGNWIATDTPESASRYELRTWVLFDRIWSRFVESVKASYGYRDISPETRDLLIIKFRNRMDDLRADRWGKDTRVLREAVAKTNEKHRKQ